jgi:hypothetical protein
MNYLDGVPAFCPARIAPPLNRFEDGFGSVSGKTIADIYDEKSRAFAKAHLGPVAGRGKNFAVSFGEEFVPNPFHSWLFRLNDYAAAGIALPRIMSDATSAIMITGPLMFPPIASGITDASTIRNPSTPHALS